MTEGSVWAQLDAAGNLELFGSYQVGTFPTSVPIPDFGTVKTIDTSGTQPWSSQTSTYDIDGVLQAQQQVLDSGNQLLKYWDTQNTHPYTELTVTKDTTGKITGAQATLDPAVAAAGSIGQVFGSAIGRALAPNNPFLQLAAGTVSGALGQAFGQVLVSSLNSDLASAAGPVFSNFGFTLAGAAAGSAASFLTAELAHAIGLQGDAATVFNAAIGGAAGSALNQAVQQVLHGEAVAINWGTTISSAGAAVAGAIGSILAHQIVTANSQGAAITGQLAGAVGSIAGAVLSQGLSAALTVLLPGIGSFVGTVLGTIVGNLVFHPDQPIAEYIVNASPDHYGGHLRFAINANADVAIQMGQAAAGIVNSYLDAVHGLKIDHAKANTVGYHGTGGAPYFWSDSDMSVIVADPETGALLGHNQWDYAKADDAVTASALDMLRSTEVVGGNLLLKRAHQHSQYTNLMALSGDLQVANDYEHYLNNREVINALIAANPNTAFTAGWAATFARVNDLGLNHYGASDFLGGLDGFLDSVKLAGLDPHVADFSVKRAGNGSITFEFHTTGSATIPGVLLAFADQSSIDASGQTLQLVFADGLAAAALGSATNLGMQSDGKWHVAASAGSNLWVGSDGVANYFEDTQASSQDILFGGAQGDWIYGHNGDDAINGGGGADVIFGQGGSDWLNGGDSNDYIKAGDGDDQVWGDAGDDALFGDDGNDRLRGAAGNDEIDGGAGTDTVLYSGRRGDYHVTYSAGTQTFTVVDLRTGSPDGTDHVTGVENFVFSDRSFGSSTVGVDLAVVTAASVNVARFTTIAASSLFSVATPGGYPIVTYEFWDSSPDANSGHFVVNGVAQGAGAAIYVTAAQLAQTSFVSGAHSDTLQMRVYDGYNWSAPDNRGWAVFNVNVPLNHAPAVTTANMHANHNQTFAASSLFLATDADNDPITTYELWDSTNNANSGHFVVNGVAQASNTVIHLTAAQLAQTYFVAGLNVSDMIQIRASDGFDWSASDTGAWSPFTINTTPDQLPVVTPAVTTATHFQSIAASSLISVTDGDGEPITKYQFWDGHRLSGTSDDNPNVFVDDSGYFKLNGVRQAEGAAIEVTAAQLSSLVFQTVSGADLLWARAYDGYAWGDWTQFTVTSPINHAPVVTATNQTILHDTTVAATSLFSVTDADNDAVFEVMVYDDNGTTALEDDHPGIDTTGYFIFNGVRYGAGQPLQVTAAQLSSLYYHTSSFGSDLLSVKAFDGGMWSSPWTTFTVTSGNSAPAVTGHGMSVGTRTSIAASSLVSATDADNDAITLYRFWDDNGTTSTSDDHPSPDNTGYFRVNGLAQSGGTSITLTPDQLAHTTFETGVGPDIIWAQAFDGISWGAWTSFTINEQVATSTSNHAPVASGVNLSATHGQIFAASALVSVSDADGNAITKYRFFDDHRADGTADDNPAVDDSGAFKFYGNTMQEGVSIEVNASELSSLTFRSGSAKDKLWYQVFDGYVWSSWAATTVDAPVNSAPVVSTSSKSAHFGASSLASTLFSVSDAQGDTIQKYRFVDNTTTGAVGHFTLGGVTQANGTIIEISPAQLSQLSFVLGNATGTDNISIQAFDGLVWSASSAFSFTATNTAPDVTVSNHSYSVHTSVALSSLFTVADANNDAVTMYQVFDDNGALGTADDHPTTDSTGYFLVNGLVKPSGTGIMLTPDQLAHTTFETGSASDILWIQAFDGVTWGTMKSFTMTEQAPQAPASNHAPASGAVNLVAAHGQTYTASQLVNASDQDGDTITKYRFWDGHRVAATTDDNQPGDDSGFFKLNGVIMPEGQAIEVNASALSSLSFQTMNGNDLLWASAFDGFTWGPYTQFTITTATNQKPVVTASDVAVTVNSVTAVASLFTVSDGDGDAILKYQFWDSTAGPSTGSFFLNGQQQAAQTQIEVLASELNQASYLAGMVTETDTVQVRAFDGFEWSDWKLFHMAAS